MMPARVALALQADGWWLRDEIVWHKPNPMPSSVEDRTTPAHEMVYLLTKKARYYYDADAIREQGTDQAPSALSFERETKETLVPGQSSKQHRLGRTSREASFVGSGKPASERQRVGINARWDEAEAAGLTRSGRNKRSVWTIATQPYAEAHFATFPEKLVEPCILAGAPVGGVVLDPFGGSGTVAMVANRLGRRAVHIDLSPEYTEQAIKRIATSRAQGEGPGVDMPVPFAAGGLWAETVP